MTTTSTARGLPPAAVPQAADPIRQAISRYQEAKADQLPELFVRVFGFSAFSSGGPNFDIDDGAEGMLADAVADQAWLDAAFTPRPAAARSTALLSRLRVRR